MVIYLIGIIAGTCEGCLCGDVYAGDISLQALALVQCWPHNSGTNDDNME